MKLALYIDFKIYEMRLIFSLQFLRRMEHAHKYTKPLLQPFHLTQVYT